MVTSHFLTNNYINFYATHIVLSQHLLSFLVTNLEIIIS